MRPGFCAFVLGVFGLSSFHAWADVAGRWSAINRNGQVEGMSAEQSDYGAVNVIAVHPNQMQTS